MSTRGAYGFYINGTEKVSYNHCDSYPSYLGLNVLRVAKAMARRNPEKLKKDVDKIRLVDEHATPTPEDIQKCGAYLNTEVGSRTNQDWYCLLREAQGDIEAAMELGVMINGAGFLYDSLFCEWAYIINLDTRELECYKGFNKAQIVSRDNDSIKAEHVGGRYAVPPAQVLREQFAHARDNSIYAGVWLMKSWPLDKLPTDKEFQAALGDD